MKFVPATDCPRCHGTGLYPDPETGAPWACDCIAPQTDPWDEEAARIPAKFRARSFKSFRYRTQEQFRARQAVEAYVEHFTLDAGNDPDTDDPRLVTIARGRECNGLLIVGPPGTGKSHLAIAALRALLVKGVRGLWWNVNDLFRTMRASHAPGGGGDSDILNELMTVDLLVLDDLCAEKDTEYSQDRLYAIVNGRYERLLPLIVTTNLGPARLRDTLGDRLNSRLHEMCERVTMPEGDYRLANMGEAFGRPVK